MTDDPILAAIQQSLDTGGDGWCGWSVAHYVVVIGLARVTADGEVETDECLRSPDGQPSYTTEGLLIHGERMWDQIESESE